MNSEFLPFLLDPSLLCQDCVISVFLEEWPAGMGPNAVLIPVTVDYLLIPCSVSPLWPSLAEMEGRMPFLPDITDGTNMSPSSNDGLYL